MPRQEGVRHILSRSTRCVVTDPEPVFAGVELVASCSVPFMRLKGLGLERLAGLV